MRRHSKVLPMSTDIILENDQQLAAAASVTALLSSVNEDEPVMLTDDSGATIDSETGEVLDEGNGAAGEGTESSTQQRKPEEESGSTATTAKEHGGASQSDDTLFDDEAAENRQRAEATAESILDEFSKAKDLRDLKAQYDGNQLELAGLPEDLADTVEAGYDRNLKRLGSTRVKVARQVAQEQAELAK
jgi:hypothetical protein